MKIFYAIDPDEKIKRQIKYYAEKLSKYLKAGRMIDPFNYHITLEYVGNIDDVRSVAYIEVLKRAAADIEQSEIVLKGVSSFVKKKRELIYLNVDGNEEISKLKKNISIDLGSKEKSFLPHITLYRDAVFKDGFSIESISDIIEHKEIRFIAKDAVLMESTLINGKIVYMILYDQKFKGANNGS